MPELGRTWLRPIQNKESDKTIITCQNFLLLNPKRLNVCMKSWPTLLGQMNGSVKEPNKFHNYETEKITRKASDAAEYIWIVWFLHPRSSCTFCIFSDIDWCLEICIAVDCVDVRARLAQFCLPAFKRLLKTELFSRSFPDAWYSSSWAWLLELLEWLSSWHCNVVL